MTVLAATAWPTNAELIRDVAELGYLRVDVPTLDPTWGFGTWWKLWRPHQLTASDLDASLSPTGTSVDFTDLPHGDDTFGAVAFDPPYKLNGTSSTTDDRYGVGGKYVSERGRRRLILDGLDECARVLSPKGYLLVKVMDQVSGGKVRWQTDVVTHHAETLGLTKVDAFLFPSYRPQPDGRSQAHARRNYSTLLVFRGPR